MMTLVGTFNKMIGRTTRMNTIRTTSPFSRIQRQSALLVKVIIQNISANRFKRLLSDPTKY